MVEQTALTADVQDRTEADTQTLTEKDPDDMIFILSDVSPLVKSFSEGSNQRIFWDQQEKYNSLKDRWQVQQWNPLLIRFAPYLKYASTSAYRAVLGSGLISLSLEITLRNYTHWTSIRDGPQFEVLQYIRRTIALDEMSPSEKHFALNIDEMKI